MPSYIRSYRRAASTFQEREAARRAKQKASWEKQKLAVSRRYERVSNEG